MEPNTQAVRRNRVWRISLCLLTGIVVLTVGVASHAQSLIGSPGAGWQTWSTKNGAQPSLGSLGDLNSNGAPYWDVPFLAFGQYSGTPAAKSVGWCLTSNGDCQGLGSALFAPGTFPFWSMPYDAAADNPGGTKPGALDPTMYFKSSRSGQSYTATLYLNSATNTQEINEFGWFETNATGSVNGTKHIIFNGGGFPPGTQAPDPVGTVRTFTPTQYFGYYYQDVSDEEDFDTGNAPPPHGCYALTIFTFNDEDCTAAGSGTHVPGQGDHVFAIFHDGSSSYWVAGQDPSMCNMDGDCNLTIVRVRPLTRD